MTSFGVATVFLIAQVCYSSAQVFLEQTPPEGSLCLGDDVMFTCGVENQNQLIWRYTLNGETMSEFFPFNDPPDVQPKFLGPLRLVLVSTEYEGGSTVGNITSKAMFTSDLTSDKNGAVITCVESDPESVTISFAVPNITNVTYCMSTISWSPSLCDADCVISVDGQGRDTVPCMDGNLDSSVPNVGSQMVVIVAADGVNQNISTNVTTKDCSGFEGMSIAMTMSSTESPAIEGGVQAGVVVGIVLVILLVAGVGLGSAFGILIYFFHQHSKKEGTYQLPLGVQESGGDDYKILLVDDQKTFKDCHQHPITHCAISPDTKYVATADNGMVVRIWDIKSFNGYDEVRDNGTFDELIERIKDHRRKNKNIKVPEIPKKRKLLLSLNWISHGESTKLVLTYNSGVIIWDTSDDDIVTLYEPKLGKEDSRNASMLCTACSPDSTFALSFTTDVTRDPPLGYLVIGDYDEVHKQKPKTFSEQEGSILCMSFSPTGKKLVMGNINGSIRMCTKDSDGSDVTYFGWKAHTGKVHDVQFGSEDEQKVYSLGQDGFFCLWDSSTTRAPLTKIKLEGYQHPLPLTGIKHHPFWPAKRIPHPAVGQSKLFGCCFAYKYILISSMDGKVLYKAVSDFDLNHVERKLLIGPVRCLDCITAFNEEYAICVLGSMNNTVHFVKLRYAIEFEETVPETDNGKSMTAAKYV